MPRFSYDVPNAISDISKCESSAKYLRSLQMGHGGILPMNEPPKTWVSDSC